MLAEEMDILKIRSEITERILSKIVTDALKKKLGENARINLRNISATANNGILEFSGEIGGEISLTDLMKLI